MISLRCRGRTYEVRGANAVLRSASVKLERVILAWTASSMGLIENYYQLALVLVPSLVVLAAVWSNCGFWKKYHIVMCLCVVVLVGPLFLSHVGFFYHDEKLTLRRLVT